MTKSDLIWAIREIDPALVREAEGDIPNTKPRTRPLRLVLIASAIVVLLSGTVLAVYAGIHWSELMETYFHVDDEDKELLDSHVQTVYASAQQDGCTFRVTQIMGDNYCMVAALEIQLPEDLDIAPVSMEELRATAEQNGYDWEDVLWRLDIGYDYDGTEDVIPAAVSAGTTLVPVTVDKDTLLASAAEYMEKYSDMGGMNGIYARYFAAQDAATDAYIADLEFESSAAFGSTPLLQEYNAETNTLTCLICVHTDHSLETGSTLVVGDLFVEDLLATYSQPENPEGGELALKSLLTEPVVLNFDAAYEPAGEEYEIYQDDTLIGTLELSPFSAYLSFPQEPDDPNRLAPNRTDYIQNSNLEVTLTDGSVIAYHDQFSGFTDTQFSFSLTEEIVDLSKLEKITLLDYTFKPVA